MEEKEPKHSLDIELNGGTGVFKSLEDGINETIDLDKKKYWESILNSLEKQKEAFDKE
jgi:hypothetical protein